MEEAQESFGGRSREPHSSPDERLPRVSTSSWGIAPHPLMASLGHSKGRANAGTVGWLRWGVREMAPVPPEQVPCREAENREHTCLAGGTYL